MRFVFTGDYSLRHQLSSRMPDHSVSGPGIYRRSGGHGEDGESTPSRRFPIIISMIQAGLADESERVAAILRQICVGQAHAAGFWSAVVLAFDGSADLRVRLSPLRGELRFGNPHLTWLKALLELSGDAGPNSPPLVIPAVYPPIGQSVIPRKTGFDGADLLIVFGRQGEFRFAPGIAGLLRERRRRVVIVELDSDRTRVTMDDLDPFLPPAVPVD